VIEKTAAYVDAQPAESATWPPSPDMDRTGTKTPTD